MGQQIASLFAKIGADTSGLKRGLQETKSGLEGAKQDFSNWKGQAIAAFAAVAGAVYTMKKAFDFAKEGAAFQQMGDSFDTLISKVGANADILEKLRKASRGTVDDMTLMSSTALLLAGTSGELASALADNAPALMEMAKAANKLNPSLGDVTFMYDSLARGIKRGSPLILDNLGILVSLEEANRKYAKSLGVSVASLTEEQQKIALLNEVLSKGNTLMEQAGGTTAAATDKFEAFTAAWKNFKDEVSRNPIVVEIVGNGANFLQEAADEQHAFNTIAQAWKLGVISGEEYIDVIDKYQSHSITAAEVTKLAQNRIDELNNSFMQTVGSSEGAARGIQGVGDAAAEAAPQISDFNDFVWQTGTGWEEAAAAEAKAKAGYQEMPGILSAVKTSLSSTSMEADAQDELINRLSVDTGVLTQTQVDMAAAVDTVTQAYAMGIISYDEALGYIKGMDDGTIDLTGDMADLEGQVKATADVIANSLGGALDKVDTGLGSKLQGMVEKLRLLFVGGEPVFDVEAAFEKAMETAGKDPATIQSAQGMAARIAAEFNQAMIDAGLMKPWEATQNIGDMFPWLKGAGAANLMKDAGIKDLLPTDDELQALADSGKALEVMSTASDTISTSGAGDEVKAMGEGATAISDAVDAGSNTEALGKALDENKEAFKNGALNIEAIGKAIAPLAGYFISTATAVGKLVRAIEQIPDSFTRTYTLITKHIDIWETQGGSSSGGSSGGGGHGNSNKTNNDETPGYASGGLFPGGKPILVGENGPEIVWPASSGWVTSNDQLSQVLGGSTTNIITVTDRSAAALLAAHLASASSKRFNDFMGG